MENGPGIKIISQKKTKDGLLVKLSDGQELYSDSGAYRSLYDSGVLYTESPQGEITLQEGARPELVDYKNLTKSNSFKDYMGSYYEGKSGVIAKGLGQKKEDFYKMNPSYKQDYDAKMQKQYVDNYVLDHPKKEDETTGSYLDRITKDAPESVSRFIQQSNSSGVQPTLYEDFNKGLYSNKNIFDSDGLINDIELDDGLSTNQKNEKVGRVVNNEYGLMEGLGDKLSIFSPLTVPGKAVQSIYKDDYSLKDALNGKKNDSNLVEDLITDPLTYTPFKAKAVKDMLSTGSLLNGAEKVASIAGENKLQKAVKLLNNMHKEKTGVNKKLNVLDSSDSGFDDTFKARFESLESDENMLNRQLRALGDERKTEALNNGIKFNEEWYNHPETKRRIDANDMEDFSRYGNADNSWSKMRSNIENKTYENAYFEPEADVQKRLDTNQKPLLNDIMGVNGYTRANGKAVPFVESLPVDINGNQSIISPLNSRRGIESTTAHEGNHAVWRAGNYLDDSLLKSGIDEINHSNPQIVKYLSNPNEIYARIMQMRNESNVKPGDKITPEMVHESLQTPTIDPLFKRAVNRERMAKLMNILPVAGAGVAIGTNKE